jgi:hypothetical protein
VVVVDQRAACLRDRTRATDYSCQKEGKASWEFTLPREGETRGSRRSCWELVALGARAEWPVVRSVRQTSFAVQFPLDCELAHLTQPPDGARAQTKEVWTMWFKLFHKYMNLLGKLMEQKGFEP